MAEILLLDAMGVLYQAGDDVGELLIPFVHAHGRAGLPPESIDLDYVEASLGRMTPDTFWARMGVDPALEDRYLGSHALIDGTLAALPRLKRRFGKLACLSNDVAAWSVKLRRRFELETWIDDWFISGDLGLRKPAPAIYAAALERLAAKPQDVIFVDDRPRNLDAAKQLGLRTRLFDVRGGPAGGGHARIRNLADLL
jgi:putative hydrolase of the HAD superfamily